MMSTAAVVRLDGDDKAVMFYPDGKRWALVVTREPHDRFQVTLARIDPQPDIRISTEFVVHAVHPTDPLKTLVEKIQTIAPISRYPWTPFESLDHAREYADSSGHVTFTVDTISH